MTSITISATEGENISSYFKDDRINSVIVNRNWVRQHDNKDRSMVQNCTRISEPEIKFYLNPNTFQYELRKVSSWNCEYTLDNGVKKYTEQLDIPVNDKKYSSLDIINAAKSAQRKLNERYNCKIQVQQNSRICSDQESQAISSFKTE